MFRLQSVHDATCQDTYLSPHPIFFHPTAKLERTVFYPPDMLFSALWSDQAYANPSGEFTVLDTDGVLIAHGTSTLMTLQDKGLRMEVRKFIDSGIVNI
ncbi:MAG: hypothetical protein BWK74_01330 [Desulfobacteraceae bacterium A6]|nr:MAG: hypothetical protein BWK74_01330 [Desulfobacteraceae bacterium A6]